MQPLPEREQAAHALQFGLALEIALHQQTLGCAPDPGEAIKCLQGQIVADLKASQLKIKFTADTNCAADQKANIQPQGFARVGHLNINLNVIAVILARQTRPVNWFFV